MADDETLRTDGQEFNCKTCVVAERLRELDEDNREAWTLYRQLNNRFVIDMQAGGQMFARLTEHLDQEPFADCCDRLRILYDVLQPPKVS